jgi:hypothetical protein
VIVTICLLILSVALIAAYLLDRGLANALEAAALILLRLVARLRYRRARIENTQRELLKEALS